MRVPLAWQADIDAAVQAARAALPEWRSWTLDQRRNVMLRFAARLGGLAGIQEFSRPKNIWTAL